MDLTYTSYLGRLLGYQPDKDGLFDFYFKQLMTVAPKISDDMFPAITMSILHDMSSVRNSSAIEHIPYFVNTGRCRGKSPSMTLELSHMLLTVRSYLFGVPSPDDEDGTLLVSMKKLSIKMIEELHLMLTSSVTSPAGKLREEILGNTETGEFLVSSVKLKERLEILCYIIDQRFDKLSDEDAHGRFWLATIFISEFLHLRPFVVFNEEVAVILFNYIARLPKRVPVTFFSEKKELYDALRLSQSFVHPDPIPLYQFFVGQFSQTVDRVVYLVADK